MDAVEVVGRYRRVTQAIGTATLAGVLRWWEQVDIFEQESWVAVAPQIARQITVGQRAAASASDPLLDTLGAVADHAPSPLRVVPDRLSGVASDGRPLESLLSLSMSRSRARYLDGASLSQARLAGRTHLTLVTTTQIADAARSGVRVSAAARPWARRFVRVVGRTACSRCIVQAGKIMYWQNNFLRHPGCYCLTVPMATDGAISPWADPDVTSMDPKAYFDSMPTAEQDRVFGQAGAESIRLGADISQVVNARSGMTTATFGDRTVRTTTVGARGRVRLMPEEIVQLAGGNRAEATRLLQFHGYLTAAPLAAAA